MNVKLFRLNSGEEILARFEEQTDSWLLKDPAILIPVGEGNIGLMPWLMYSKAAKGISIPKTFVAFIVDPLDELKTQYDSSLNKGLVTPSKNVNNTSGLKLTL
jgi:hypothetical protein